MPRQARDPIHVRLTDERRGELLAALRELYETRFDEELSDFRAEAIVELFVRALGPPIYNQAIQDACAFMTEKVADMDAELYETEAP